MILKQTPKPGTATLEEEAKIIERLWTEDAKRLLDELDAKILIHPVLQRPDPEQRFDLKTYLSKEAYGTLYQTSLNNEKSAKGELYGKPCVLDIQIEGKRLVPLAMISKRTKEAEKQDHSAVGEAKEGYWAFRKFHHWFFGSQLTWITDSVRMKAFLDNVNDPSHQCQRLRMGNLQYEVRIVHREAYMMKQVDTFMR